MYHVDDTIAAVASPPGGSLRGIIRMSGPDVIRCLKQCFQSADGGDQSRRIHALLHEGQ